MLAREATVRELVPEFAANRREKALQICLAEFAGNDSLNVLRAFVSCVFSGATPPPKILVRLAETFAVYLDADGALSLDEAFSLKRKQAAGHPLKQRKKKEQRGRILYLIWNERRSEIAKGNRCSIEKAAGKIINQLNLSDSEETLKAEYIAMKVEKIFGDAYKAMGELGKLTGEK